MAFTVRNLITSALVSSGGVGIGDTPSAEETARALNLFNQQVAILSLDNLWAPTVTTVTGSFTAGQSEYTVGTTLTTEDIQTPVFNDIIALSIKDSGMWYPLKEINQVNYFNSHRDSATDTPSMFMYQRTLPAAKLTLYRVPDASYEYSLTTNYMKTSYGLNDSLEGLPPGYTGYLEYALAALLAVDYGLDPSSLLSIAATRKAQIEIQNYEVGNLVIEQTFDKRSGRFDITTGDWR